MTPAGDAASLLSAVQSAPLGIVWAAPFVGLLLSIAFLPSLEPGWWHRRAGSVTLFWAGAFLLAFAGTFGLAAALRPLARTLLHDYLPFVLLLTALYTTAGGIHVRGELRAAPGHNTAALAVGALLASVMGTTGASMLLIRPLLRANAHRPSSTHVVVFFIFIVGNIGGALTPLGDPPLLLGFLHGVGFFWTTTHLLAPMLFLVVCLLALFHALDLQRFAHEARPPRRLARSEPLGAWAAEGVARVGHARGWRQGAKRRTGRAPVRALQRRMRPLAGPTLRAEAIQGPIRRCRLVVWLATRPRQRLVSGLDSPQRGPRLLPPTLLCIDGGVNVIALGVTIGLVLVNALWTTDVGIGIGGVVVGLPQLLCDVGLVGVIGVSLVVTPAGVRASNEFSWAPMREVAQLFAGLFVTMIPVLAMLESGRAGAFGGVLHWVSTPEGRPLPWAYFWATGALSSFLDNAPTYLVFFQLAGGDARTLTTSLASTLAAMSAGAVFMGANTYIGNAPNFMIKAIAERQGVRMPGFFGYMAWSGMILLPLFLLVSVVWFR